MSPTRSSPRACENQITASQPCDPVQNDPCHHDREREECKDTPRRADSVSSLFHFFYPVLRHFGFTLSEFLDILVDSVASLSIHGGVRFARVHRAARVGR